ncbi:hypothetical protein CEXT_648331 [Caerostris extrusa]|uniref:Uncharacterized protein n=1 Tax=Caerostris extrusa TaxID=172846 RepID=A0AAV4XEP8_CAEEX|nr:hypothetical protein CEXT_648331 [Caerostris extrusa]
MLGRWHGFFRNLFRGSDCPREEAIQTAVLDVVENGSTLEQETPTLYEVRNEIKNLNNNRATGPDGIKEKRLVILTYQFKKEKIFSVEGTAREEAVQIAVLDVIENDRTLEHETPSLYEVRKAIKNLNNNRATGPNVIKAQLINIDL